MKNEVMNRLSAVIGALNAISVNGKQNLSNLAGSISVIEEIAAILSGSDIIDTYKNAEK